MSKFVHFIIFICLCPVILFSVASASTTLTYEYDANGNLVSGDGKYYEYDDANKLLKVRHGDETGPVIAEYFYDYTGQRVKKIENGVTTYYIGKHYEEQVTDISQTSAKYYFANGERVAKKDDSGNLAYFHSDHLGSTNVVTDSSGNLIEKTNYYPFGEIRQGGSEKYAYTGKEKDHLTDWYYYEARYYNSGFVHFTQADLLISNLYNPQTLNRYSYVLNNPIKYIDPFGYKVKGKTIDDKIKLRKLKKRGENSETFKEIFNNINDLDEVYTIHFENTGKGSRHDGDTRSIVIDTSNKNWFDKLAILAHELVHAAQYMIDGTNLPASEMRKRNIDEAIDMYEKMEKEAYIAKQKVYNELFDSHAMNFKKNFDIEEATQKSVEADIHYLWSDGGGGLGGGSW